VSLEPDGFAEKIENNDEDTVDVYIDNLGGSREHQ